MSRKVKNIIMILIIIIAVILSAFTMNSIKNDNNINQESNKMMKQDDTAIEQGEKSENGEVSDPPEMSMNNTDMDSKSQPPEKPDGEDENNQIEQGDMEQPSEIPSENGEMEKPEQNGMNNAQDDTSGQMSMPNGEDIANINSQATKISTSYYIIFGIEGFIISILLIYLIMSSFNKKTIKETLNGAGTIILYVVLVIALTAGLIFLQAYITNNVFINNDENQIQNNNMQTPGENMNSSSTNIEYSASKEITEDTTIEGEEYSSSTADENVVLVTGDIDVTLSDILVEKEGDSDGGDDSNFYGNNSAIIAKSGANLILKNINVTTKATGANGVFSYGGSATTNNSSSDGTTITISDSKITTTGDNAGGIMTTGGGKTVASNLTINTSGTSSAAIRTDRGGGTVTVNGGTYTTTGSGSPTVYSTADITVSDATLVAKASEGIVIEGANSVTIDNCNLTDSNTKLNGQSTTYKNIFLYQSMSGDASSGTAEFTANDSTITTNNGDSFYITNTSATINLTNNTIVNNDTTGNFLRAQKDSWGSSGSNGGNVTLVMTNQEAIGNIVIDSISTLDMTMKTNSYYEGTINADNQAKSITLILDASSKIKLTGDSYITELEDSDTSYSNIDFNGYTLYVNGTAIN